jgi:hypothetical protein
VGMAVDTATDTAWDTAVYTEATMVGVATVRATAKPPAPARVSVEDLVDLAPPVNPAPVPVPAPSADGELSFHCRAPETVYCCSLIQREGKVLM